MIREAEEGEGPLIAEEFWYPLAKESEPYSELNELTDDALELARTGFEKLLKEDDQYIFILEVDDVPVGYVSAGLDERPTRVRGKRVTIVDLYVEEEFRNRGHGTALVERVEQLAEAENCDFVEVATEWENEGARRFYERHGYAPKQVEFTKTIE